METGEPSPPEEPTAPPLDPRIAAARPGWALVVLAAPIAIFVLVIVLYIGMISLGFQGRGGDGAPVTYEVGGCEDAGPLLEARLGDIGLPVERTSHPGGMQLHTRRIGRPEIDATLADTLAQPGAFELRHDDDVLARNAQITDATYRLDGMMDPWLLLRLDDDATKAVVAAVRSDPTGRLTFVLDGTPIAMQPNRRSVRKGEVEGIPLDEIDAAERMRRIASWSVIIDHGPLPCPVQVREAEAP